MRRRVASVAVLIAFTFASSGCLLSQRGGEQPVERQSLGTFALSSDSLGHVSLAPASSSAGDRQFFLGADFEDVVRDFYDPAALEARLASGSLRSVLAVTDWGEIVYMGLTIRDPMARTVDAGNSIVDLRHRVRSRCDSRRA